MPFTKSDLQYPQIVSQYDLLNVPSDSGLLLAASIGLNITKQDVDYSIAFQPIVNISDKSVFGYEALVRGVNNEGADFVLSQLNESNRYQFDQATKVKAITLAKKLSLQGMLSINISPCSVYKPEVCVPKTLETDKYKIFCCEIKYAQLILKLV